MLIHCERWNLNLIHLTSFMSATATTTSKESEERVRRPSSFSVQVLRLAKLTAADPSMVWRIGVAFSKSVPNAIHVNTRILANVLQIKPNSLNRAFQRAQFRTVKMDNRALMAPVTPVTPDRQIIAAPRQWRVLKYLPGLFSLDTTEEELNQNFVP
jgi:hypothetical protein